MFCWNFLAGIYIISYRKVIANCANNMKPMQLITHWFGNRGIYSILFTFLSLYIKVSQKPLGDLFRSSLSSYHCILFNDEPIHLQININIPTNLPEIQTQLGTTHDAPECERCHKGIDNKGAYDQTTPEIVYVYFLRIIGSKSLTLNCSVIPWAYMVFKYMVQCVIIASQLVGYENK